MGKKVKKSDEEGNDWEANENEFLCSSPQDGKGKRIWKKVKYQLVEYHMLPDHMKDNEYILRYYRCQWPFKETFLSVFSIHNETLNVWTHLLGFVLFLSLTIYTAMKIPKADVHNFRTELMSCLPSLPQFPDIHNLLEELKSLLHSMPDFHVREFLTQCYEQFHNNHTDGPVLQNVKEDFVNIIAPLVVGPVTRWPFYTFLGGAMFCLLASSACHLLSCHSPHVAYIMLRLDYGGIAALISTSFYPPVYYSFMCHPFFCKMYIGIITVIGFVTMMVSLLPVFQTPEYRSLRASLYFGMGVSGAIPVLHKLVLYWGQPEALQTTLYEFFMGSLYGFGALIYAMRIPEKWNPGKYDIVGNSHQLFHCLVVAGAYTHYQTGLIYLKWRDAQGCPNNTLLT